jgi:hypothetical protein
VRGDGSHLSSRASSDSATPLGTQRAAFDPRGRGHNLASMMRLS